jgi:uncharacterized protein (DUF934 family)
MTKKIILDRAIVVDEYVELKDGEPVPAGAQHVLVSLSRWAEEHAALTSTAKNVGVVLPSDKLPEDVVELGRLRLIAIQFPRFTDGRGYSVAKLLRDRFGYLGQLRAVGWVLRDNLLYMERVGFNAFDLLPGKPLESGLEAFHELPIAYQATVSDKRPLYRRRV